MLFGVLAIRAAVSVRMYVSLCNIRERETVEGGEDSEC